MNSSSQYINIGVPTYGHIVTVSTISHLVLPKYNINRPPSQSTTDMLKRIKVTPNTNCMSSDNQLVFRI